MQRNIMQTPIMSFVSRRARIAIFLSVIDDFHQALSDNLHLFLT